MLSPRDLVNLTSSKTPLMIVKKNFEDKIQIKNQIKIKSERWKKCNHNSKKEKLHYS